MLSNYYFPLFHERALHSKRAPISANGMVISDIVIIHSLYRKGMYVLAQLGLKMFSHIAVYLKVPVGANVYT